MIAKEILKIELTSTEFAKICSIIKEVKSSMMFNIEYELRQK